MTACLLYDKIHKNQAENLLHLMLYFSPELFLRREYLTGILFYAKLSIVAERVLLWLSW